MEKVDTGPGGADARLGNLGYRPTFHEEISSAKLPDAHERDLLGSDGGTLLTIHRIGRWRVRRAHGGGRGRGWCLSRLRACRGLYTGEQVVSDGAEVLIALVCERDESGVGQCGQQLPEPNLWTGSSIGQSLA